MSNDQYREMRNLWDRKVGNPSLVYDPPAYIRDRFPEVRDLCDQYAKLVEKLDEIHEQYLEKAAEPERQAAEITSAVLAGKKLPSEKSGTVLHAEALAILEAGRQLRRQINDVVEQIRQWAVDHRAELFDIILKEELPKVVDEAREAWAAFNSALAKRGVILQHRKDLIDAFLSRPNAPGKWLHRARLAADSARFEFNLAYTQARRDSKRAMDTLATFVDAFDPSACPGDPFTSDVVDELDEILREDEERRALQPLSNRETKLLRQAQRKQENGQELDEREVQILERYERHLEAKQRAKEAAERKAEEAAKRRASAPPASRVWVF